jgi:hypothetical protein
MGKEGSRGGRKRCRKGFSPLAIPFAAGNEASLIEMSWMGYRMEIGRGGNPRRLKRPKRLKKMGIVHLTNNEATCLSSVGRLPLKTIGHQ